MFVDRGSPDSVDGVLVLFLLDVWSDFRHGPLNQLFFNNADLQQPESEFAETHNDWQYYTVTN